jgi:hypothetical protein
MSFKERITWEQLRSVNAASLTGSYVKIGGPLLFPSFVLRFVNNSNVLVTISLDGINDYDVIPANSFVLYDEDTSGNPTPEGVPQGTQFYVNGSAGTGSIYLVSLYLY